MHKNHKDQNLPLWKFSSFYFHLYFPLLIIPQSRSPNTKGMCQNDTTIALPILIALKLPIFHNIYYSHIFTFPVVLIHPHVHTFQFILLIPMPDIN